MPSPAYRQVKFPSGIPWRSGQVALGIMLVAVLALTAVEVVVLLAGRDNQALVTVLSSVSLGLVIFVVVGLLALLPHKAPLSALGLTRPGFPGLRTVGLTVLALLLSLGFTAAYAYLVQTGGVDVLVPPEIPPGIVFPGGAVVLTFLALAVWTPLSEEVFFRGFIFAGLLSRWGVVGASVISALIFSVFHDPLIFAAPFNLEFYLENGATGVLIPIFVTGLLLAWLYRKTGSLWSCIAAHAGQNATALMATVYVGA
jgi:uncharacterized protein